jgi:ribose 5-phosphate isomerase B
MKIAIANDHAGYALKKAIMDTFSHYDWLDLGTNSTDSVDYPDFGLKLGQAIAEKDALRGILICGTGIGISIAANRLPQVRAAVCSDVTAARLTRLHNDANVLALGERLIGTAVAFDIVEAFMSTDFEGGRHAKRVQKLSKIS